MFAVHTACPVEETTMMINRWNMSLACLLLCILSAAASAQTAGDQFQAMQKIVPGLNLTDDQQSSMHDIFEPLLKQTHEARESAKQSTPQQLQTKVLEIEKLEQETLDKVIAELTDDQKAKYFPQMAKLLWLQVAQNLVATKKAVATLDITDDQKKQALAEIEKTGNTVVSIQGDAKQVSDATSEKDYIKKLAQAQLDLYGQLRDELGVEDAGKLMKAGRQPAGKSAPATQP
jgi:Spy/CpxP family protein refolding chaperone